MSISEERLLRINQLKEIAHSAVASVTQEYDDLRAELVKGVSLSVAHRIIDELWGKTAEGMHVKTQLYEQFPIKNGRAILNSELSKVSGNRLRDAVKPVDEYFNEIVEAIETLVEQGIEKLKASSVNDEAVLVRYNEFRKEVLRYIALSSYAFYDIQNVLRSENVTSWEDINYAVVGVDEGDYLFLDSFTEQLKSVHQEKLSVKAVLPTGYYYKGSLSSFGWRHDEFESRIQLPYLFFRHLSKFEL